MKPNPNPDNLNHEDALATRKIINNSEAVTDDITVEQAFKVLFIDRSPALMRGYPAESYYPTPTEDNHISFLGLSWECDSAIDFEFDEESCEVSAYVFREDRENFSFKKDTADSFYKIWFEQNMPFWEGRRPINNWGDSVKEAKTVKSESQ